MRNLSVVEVDLVADDDEGEVDGTARPRLYEEQIVPVVELLKRRGDRDVVDEDAAVGAAKVADTETLKALLSRRVPYLHVGKDILSYRIHSRTFSATCRLDCVNVLNV